MPDARIGDVIAADETSSVDELLDRAVAAINRGDRVTANSLAQQVLTADKGNVDAEDLLATSDEPVRFAD
jgi:alkyl sulfatase BDS1-like metallo-beta-lactamase superfamily hydrolase